ncbi:MAG: DUF4330 family protein [Clostridia bacterium]|nr:DUF4330 family protein [Clostridia bacterium]
MKRKWNWLDTVIVCVAVVLVVGVCFFLFRPNGGQEQAVNETDYYISFETDKAKKGTFDAIKTGDTVYIASNGKELGIIEKVEMLPSQMPVFNEQTKTYDLASNADYPYCRVTVKTTGYKNDSGAVLVKNKAVIFDDEWALETVNYRFNTHVVGVQGGQAK